MHGDVLHSSEQIHNKTEQLLLKPIEPVHNATAFVLSNTEIIIFLYLQHATIVHQDFSTAHKTLPPSALIQTPFYFIFYRIIE